MNKSLKESLEFIYEFVPSLFRSIPEGALSVTFFPSAPFIHSIRNELGDDTPVYIGAQDLHTEKEGAYTGAISGHQLRSVGASHVLIGHSERRYLFGEDNKIIAKKLSRALKDRLIPVLCVGEQLREREAGKTTEIVREQLEFAWEGHEVTGGAIIAYEPVWAIGTGKNAEPKDAEEMCSFIRHWIGSRFSNETASAIRILYGGSVDASNIKSYTSLPDVDGVLVGSASLDVKEFLEISKSVAARSLAGK